jgi:uncharacterized membrane protein YdjX (TVP38/TMEM64 family)
LSIGKLLYIPGWVLLEGDVFAVGKEWGGSATYIGAMASSLISFAIIKELEEVRFVA